MARTFSVSQDLGDGWRLVSVTEPPLAGSRIATVVVTKGGKSYTARFNIDKQIMLDDPKTLTATQLHIIQTVILQLLKK